MITGTRVLADRLDHDLIARIPAVTAAMLLGLFLIYGVGFAQPSAIYNAAHDGRHTFAFPCH